jgi:hypothetical protein
VLHHAIQSKLHFEVYENPVDIGWKPPPDSQNRGPLNWSDIIAKVYGNVESLSFCRARKLTNALVFVTIDEKVA